MMQRLLKHKLLIGAMTLLAAGSAGGAYAATQSGANPRQAFLNDVAKRLGVTPSRVRAAVRGAMLDRLEAAVKAGELTQAQADGIKQRLEQGGGLPLFGGPRFRPPGPGGVRHGPLSTAAQYLGLTELQLLGDLRGGRTLAQVAQAHGKSVAGLEQALRSAAKARLDRLVAVGWLTQAQEQRRLSRLGARIDELVQHGPPFERPMPGPPFAGPVPGPPGPPVLGPPGPPGA